MYSNAFFSETLSFTVDPNESVIFQNKNMYSVTIKSEGDEEIKIRKKRSANSSRNKRSEEGQYQTGYRGRHHLW